MGSITEIIDVTPDQTLMCTAPKMWRHIRPASDTS